MKHLYFPFLLLLVSSSFAQKLTFDIFLFGNKVGQTVVERIVKNDSITQYTLSSASEAKVFFVVRRIKLHYDLTFKRNQLISSFSKSTRNDELHVTNIRLEGSKYKIDREDASFLLSGPVHCSTIQLFFAEPCNLKVLSERMGEFRYIKKTGDGVYESEMQDGLTYFYRYKNGRLVELEMRKGLLGSAYIRPH